jgi:hypothetical protein
MSLKKRLIDRDILNPHDPAIRFQLTDLIHEQKGIPMGQ